jgi:transposase
VPYLVQLLGIGLLTAITILGAVGDITRFGSAKQLGGYAGLGVGVQASGKTHRVKGITKQGRRELRCVMADSVLTCVDRQERGPAIGGGAGGVQANHLGLEAK